MSSLTEPILAHGCGRAFVEGPVIADWLTVALTAAVVATGGTTGQPQGPPLPPPLMQVHSSPHMTAAAAAASAALASPAGRLRRVKRVVCDLNRFAAPCDAH